MTQQSTASKHRPVAPIVATPSGMPCHRYTPFKAVDLPDRQWPAKMMTKAPRWLSTDLRDGNQSLIDPMSPTRKRSMFDMLVKMGYKEIEVGFPSASQTDFDFVRELIEGDKIPQDVRISVLTQAREDLIERTVQSLAGAQRATVHLYNATAPVFRKVVFRIGREECKALAVEGTRHVMKYAEQYLGDCDFGYEYSPEIFMDTELDFALEICEAVMDVWQPGPGREIILNLPCTVERSTPNVYADQIEWMSRNLSRPRAHLPVRAHAQRPGHRRRRRRAGGDGRRGPRRGLPVRQRRADRQRLPGHARAEPVRQGIDPMIDFSNIDEIRRTVEYCNQLPVHPRHPYAGELVYTAFSGSHQDAIKKGFDALEADVAAAGDPAGEHTWDLPYLPIDPHDVGRSYEAVIRVNCQSGKGGVAYVLKTEHYLDLPRRMQIEFSKGHPAAHRRGGRRGHPGEIWAAFRARVPGRRAGRAARPPVLVRRRRQAQAGGGDLRGRRDPGSRGTGNGPISAFCAALASVGIEVRVLDYAEHALTEGTDAQAASYVECAIDGEIFWGVGIDTNTATASMRAILSAVNRSRQ